LPDVRVSSYFLDIFGRPKRKQTTASERTQDPSLTQALHVINGGTLNSKLRSPDGTVSRLVHEGATDEQVIDQLYLAALSRKPSPTERRLVLDALNAARHQDGDTDKARQLALEDITWAMLTSKEFLFNH
jgi:hypothetical protein